MQGNGIILDNCLYHFARKVVRENRIPFEVNADPFYSESNMTFLRNAVKALNNGEGTAHDLIEVD